MMTKEGYAFSKIFNFMTIRVGVVVLGCGLACIGDIPEIFYSWAKDTLHVIGL